MAKESIFLVCFSEIKYLDKMDFFGFGELYRQMQDWETEKQAHGNSLPDKDIYIIINLKVKNIHEMYQKLWYNTEVFIRKK